VCVFFNKKAEVLLYMSRAHSVKGSLIVAVSMSEPLHMSIAIMINWAAGSSRASRFWNS
jgi:hypothetical protein